MMNYISSSFTLGILGGGQLGKMFLAQTQKYDICTRVLDAAADAPCKIGSNHFEVGSLLDYQRVYDFGKKCDVLTIEIENVCVEALFDLEKQGVRVFPKPASLQIIQNKATQKEFYRNNNIPTAPFRVFDSTDALLGAVEQGELSLPLVWKSARFGYDGNGVKIIRSVGDVQGLPNGQCIAEELIAFEKELAVIVARTPSGAVTSYPVVEMLFHPEANQVEFVLCPAQISEQVSVKAQQIAQEVAQKLDMVGLLAVEMFLGPTGEIMVNEVAPRPHNSGHYSIEGSYTCQFEQHLRSILDLPLGSTQSKCTALMVNLVGEEGHTGSVVYEQIDQALAMSGVSLHIYGKKTTKPFRKMGHITIVGDSPKEVIEKGQKVKQMVKVKALETM